jgi:hypothetical protein
MPRNPANPRTGRQPYEPTAQERQWVTVAAAGAMPMGDIAAKLGISVTTLRKACRKELNTGLATCEVQVHANLLRIAAGDSKSAAWAGVQWLRMRAPERWTDRVVVEPSATPMRVLIEFVGDAAAAGEQATPRDSNGTRLPNEARKHVQLVG